MINNLKLTGSTIILALIIFVTWYVTRDHYQGITKNIQLDMADAVQKELLAQISAAEMLNEKRKTAEESHAKDQLNINHLRDQLAGVRIDKICGNAMQPTNTTAQDTNGGGRILPDRVDEEFARLQSRVGQLIQRCDQLNIDARQANSEL